MERFAPQRWLRFAKTPVRRVAALGQMLQLAPFRQNGVAGRSRCRPLWRRLPSPGPLPRTRPLPLGEVDAPRGSRDRSTPWPSRWLCLAEMRWRALFSAAGSSRFGSLSQALRRVGLAETMPRRHGAGPLRASRGMRPRGRAALPRCSDWLRSAETTPRTLSAMASIRQNAAHRPDAGCLGRRDNGWQRDSSRPPRSSLFVLYHAPGPGAMRI